MKGEFIIAALVSAVLVSTAIASLLLLRHKNRLIWRELFRLREQLIIQRQEIVDVRKQVVIAAERERMRLPALMTSQYGEDILLWNFFDHKREGFYVEVGAYDGVGFSNTYFFEAVGWTGLLIEPVPALYRACLSSRPFSRVINTVVGKGESRQSVEFSVAEGCAGVGTLSFFGDNPQQLKRIHKEGGVVRTIEVPLVSLNSLLEDHRKEIDFVSIDVEGREMDVLQGFDLQRFRPRVLVIEDNSNGADTSVKEWLGLHGYLERFRCEHNVFYTHKDDKGSFRW
jgi:FkbM family methyltransferase